MADSEPFEGSLLSGSIAPEPLGLLGNFGGKVEPSSHSKVELSAFPPPLQLRQQLPLLLLLSWDDPSELSEHPPQERQQLEFREQPPPPPSAQKVMQYGFPLSSQGAASQSLGTSTQTL